MTIGTTARRSTWRPAQRAALAGSALALIAAACGYQASVFDPVKTASLEVKSLGLTLGQCEKALNYVTLAPASDGSSPGTATRADFTCTMSAGATTGSDGSVAVKFVAWESDPSGANPLETIQWTTTLLSPTGAFFFDGYAGCRKLLRWEGLPADLRAKIDTYVADYPDRYGTPGLTPDAQRADATARLRNGLFCASDPALGGGS